MRARLLKEIAPLAKQLGEALVALLVPQLEHVRDRAIEDAKAKLRADLDALTATPKSSPPIAKRRKKKRKPTVSAVKHAAAPTKPSRASSSSSRAPVPTRAAPSPSSAAPKGIERTERLHARCSRCGKAGHNARTCGYEPPTERPAPPPLANRFAKIEASARARGTGIRGVGITAEQAAARRVSGEPSIADQIATANPCRDENCRISELHAAHGVAA
jgi:hypothetical protein